MNNKLSPFQIIILVVSIVVILVAVAVFAFRQTNSRQTAAPVTIWGTIDASIITSLQNQINEKNRRSLNLVYSQKRPETFESEMVEALAAGTAPDLFILPDELLYKQQNKLFKIPYQNYPQREFKDTFVEGAEALLTKDGIWGLPFTMDPLVLYWNRGKLNNAGISKAPEYWDDFIVMVPQLVKRDSSLTIEEAAVSLGEFRNIRNAKSIFVALMMQAGNPIITTSTDSDGVEQYVSTFADRFGFTVRPADATLNFYSQFSNPTKDLYTWNRSLPFSDEMFLANDLAFYLGYASEYKNFLQKNPNLNFDVSIIPQSQSSESKKTLAKFNFLTLSRNTKNLANAYNVIRILTSSDSQKIMAELTDLPPVRRDLLQGGQSDSVSDVFYRSALISKTFLDPNPTETANIISELIESFTSGRARLTDAVDRAGQQFNNLIKQ